MVHDVILSEAQKHLGVAVVVLATEPRYGRFATDSCCTLSIRKQAKLKGFCRVIDVEAISSATEAL